MKLGLKTSTLTTPHRQKDNLEIKELGEKCRLAIKSNKFPKFEANGKNIFKLTGSEFRAKVDEIYLSDEYKLNNKTAKIICYTNNRVHDYNAHVRKIQGYSEDLEIGEEIVNKDPIIAKGIYYPIGTITKITSISDSEYMGIKGYEVELNNEVSVFTPKNIKHKSNKMKEYAALKEWPSYFLLKESVIDLRSLHSITTHSSQGSTYKNVFLDLTDISKCTQNSITARLLYVAITRASHNLYINGELNARRYY